MLEAMLNTAPEAAAIGQHFIPLYIDFADKETRDSLYYRALLDRYKPRGYPVLLVALPDGTEVMRQSGYAGETRTEPEWRKRTLQFITAAVAQSDKAAAAPAQAPRTARLPNLDEQPGQARVSPSWRSSMPTRRHSPANGARRSAPSPAGSAKRTGWRSRPTTRRARSGGGSKARALKPSGSCGTGRRRGRSTRRVPRACPAR